MMRRMRWFSSNCPLLLLVIFCGHLLGEQQYFRPCSEISKEFQFPCTCALGPIEPALDGNPSISLNCDRVVFPGEFPSLPYGAPIVSFSQRWVGYQALPTQVFQSSDIPLRSVDLSGNSLRRLTEKLLQGLQTSLVELRLADNLLGDTLNPIFSTNEFHTLSHLQILDISGNLIKAIEEGILEGCQNLQELYLDRNSFTSIPSTSLNGPKSLKVLSLKSNRIGIIKSLAFQAQPHLEKIDLSNNLLSVIEGGSMNGLDGLKTLKLSTNRLTRFNSDVFQGADNLQHLDLSENFIVEFPKIALKPFKSLRYLNLSSNLIQQINNNNLQSLTSLYHLDLSRNNIGNIPPGTFLGLSQLRRLDISVNSLRAIEDDAFEGLDNLEFLSLKDNNILLIPALSLTRLPKLITLHLDYNRVAALSGDILRSIGEKVKHLILAKNVVRELPAASFQYFGHLETVDLTRNLLTTIKSDAFLGIEDTLIGLYLSQNKIKTFSAPNTALTKLQVLDLSDNNIKELSKNVLSMLPNLKYLNLSHNYHLSTIPSNLLHTLEKLEIFDFSFIGLKLLTKDFFVKNSNLKEIILRDNALGELPDGTFSNLPNLTKIDLSYNKITNIRQGAFVNIMNIQELLLKGNQLNSFKGEFFNTGTSLEILDISDNQLSYLFPSSFRIHPRLRRIYANSNKFNFFPAELIATLQFLEFIDLSNNALKTVEEMDFARLPRLRSLLLSYNQLESISEMAFHNSTQLQILDLSYNKIERLGERTFEGLIRLEYLNLEGNILQDLPETIFERSRIQMLENINLAHNLFQVTPLKSLQRQYFFVSKVDLSFNRIKEIPADDSIMVNIKNLDLSFNPLSKDSIRNILGEPKTVRELNMAGTSMEEVIPLETPFLTSLNLSYNNIKHLSSKVFERTTLLEILDISHNRISNISDYSKIWSLLKNLQIVNMSANPIKFLTQLDLQGLDILRQLSIHSLPQCERIEKGAFKWAPNLAVLNAYDYPKLGYIDVQGLLQHIPSLERVNVESKDAAVGSDQLQSVLHPRLKELGLIGSRLRSISSGTLSGIKGPEVTIRLINTSLTSLPPALFFPVPRSSKIVLDVSGSKLTSLSPQMLVTLEDRKGDLRLMGLETNPIICDCGARGLRKWLASYSYMGGQIKCFGPEHLAGKHLQDIDNNELTCDARKVTIESSTTVSTISTMNQQQIRSKTAAAAAAATEPEIIWSLPVTEKTLTISKTKKPPASLNNDDTLIIGIVGGVVAFIAILIIIICIIRLKMSTGHYRGGGVGGTGAVVGSSCACSVKGTVPPATIYSIQPPPPPYGAAGFSATLPHKISSSGNGGGGGRPSNYSTMGRVPYYTQTNQPSYFIAAFPKDEKIYR